MLDVVRQGPTQATTALLAPQVAMAPEIISLRYNFSHGTRIASSPKQLQHLLDAAFEFDGSNSIIDEVYLGFLPTPYHNHMRTKISGRDPSSLFFFAYV